eukprot:TRINITY_DN3578_c0_g2_i1.p2 TRINITY_DN3578_c0_g2~~TRINITY_DN3578_c0_g2_i1.p2  ORF type:complete len:159 (+),score=31.41 TRINITY_DN3578_c0_g2_i1:726-1202(+)
MNQKNYAFVTFSEKSEAVRAKTSAHGTPIEGRPMRISWGRDGLEFDGGMTVVPQPVMNYPQFILPTNNNNIKTIHVDHLKQTNPDTTTIFLGNLAPTVTEEILEGVYKPFGNITRIKLNSAKHYAFVTFETRREAEVASETTHELLLEGRPLRVGWGH